MSRTTFGRKTRAYAKALCFVGLMSAPGVTAMASSISLTETSGVYSLAAENSTVKQVFDYIERHSKYVFVYDQQVKNLLSQKVNITTKGKSVEAILSEVCRQVGLTYRINDRQVSIMAGRVLPITKRMWRKVQRKKSVVLLQTTTASPSSEPPSE